MSRITVVLAVFVLLAMAQAGQAATLEEGWFAYVRAADAYVYGLSGPELITGGYFYSTPTGQSGPFSISSPLQVDWQRYVAIPSSVHGIGSDDSLIMPLYLGLSQGTLLAGISLSWQTDYDPSQMRLEFWRTRNDGSQELLWTQSQGGPQSGGGGVAFDTYIEGLSTSESAYSTRYPNRPVLLASWSPSFRCCGE